MVKGHLPGKAVEGKYLNPLSIVAGQGLSPGSGHINGGDGVVAWVPMRI